jgi:SpoVK/Ycf46/Vps4 family AAA+-type ATPase
VVILTTNGKERIDNAFNRRIDVEVDFPLPGYEERLSLWRSHLGEQQAISQEAFGTIASYCDFTGGQVRNAVLAAATCAEDEQIGMHDLLRGILLEYDKLGRKVPKAIEQLHSH